MSLYFPTNALNNIVNKKPVALSSKGTAEDNTSTKSTDELKFSGKQHPETKNIVIIGNGLAGISVARGLNKFAKKNNTLVNVTIIGKDNQYVFKPMLPDALNSDPASIPMSDALGKKSAVQFIQAEVSNVSLDENNKTVTSSAGKISYDYLVVAVGGKTNFFNTQGAQDNSLILETRFDLETIQASALKKLAEAKTMSAEALKEHNPLNFTIVGAGATGVELAFELKHYIDRLLSKETGTIRGLEAEVTLIEATDDILPGFDEKQKALVKDRFEKHGITVKYKTSVQEVTESQGLIAKDKNTDPPTVYTIDTIDPIWVTGVKANPFATTLDVERVKGKEQIIVDANLTLPNNDNIYVIGDVAAAKDKTGERFLPSTGQVAGQEGYFVAEDLIKRIKGKEAKRHDFEYKSKGLMLSAGPNDGFAHLLDKFLLKGRLAGKLRQTIYKQKLHQG